ncbi:tetratricopeptide repeat protein [Acidisphaera sp. S103]|uniref:tetratricopeptide repeat protein n=1 Tax=Acidisphaera sp. S103 TaxID=1747223 RepID=UPI00131C54E9|nr:hypothetical protein [Acidisphaera sp. S103]
MKWKETLLTALISLLVAIIAGIFVFYFTRDKRVEAEKIIYYVENSATFASSQGDLRFVTLVVKNIGTKSAHNLRVAADFGQIASVQDKRIILSSGPAATFKDASSGGHLDVTIDDFSATESATISMLVKESGEHRYSDLLPTIGVQSNDSLGELVALSSLHPDDDNKFSKTSRVILTGIMAIVAFFPLFGMRFILPILTTFVGRRLPTRPNLNNTAFLYLQQGLIEDAGKLLETAIATRGADAVTLANYGLTLGLQGNVEAALKRFEAAEWWAGLAGERAVVEYDRATLYLSQRQFAEAKVHLKKAFSLSRSEIGRYCELSVFIRSAGETDPEISRLVAAKGR